MFPNGEAISESDAQCVELASRELDSRFAIEPEAWNERRMAWKMVAMNAKCDFERNK